MNDTGEANRLTHEICQNSTYLPTGETPAIGAAMFAAGVLGNLIALVLLASRKKGVRGKCSLFLILVTGLVITDLLGTCMISPVVMVSYTQNLTLCALDTSVCSYFAFAMTFFSLATMLVLFAMALERAFAIGHPYFYEKFIRKRCGLITFPVIYCFCCLFCLLPFMGIGEYVQYCPGTWCFINMRGDHGNGKTNNVYAILYATFLVILIVAVISCNLIVMVSLVKMHKRQKSRRMGSLMVNKKERMSMSEEIDHLIILSLMTTIFAICSVPFAVRVYINSFTSHPDDKLDLLALRFLSVNPIIDPWVFTILRPSVLRVIRYLLCCQIPRTSNMTDAPTLTSRISFNKHNVIDMNYGSSQKKPLNMGEKSNQSDKTDI
ncbi:prostaglandin E2 receptor EP2 subtype-like [Pelobates fuscus]|uniref:prostaglandin E2 receptor EP2 subtype-like n=1 Tax=Pelobates fuscus TaxID=191477 RepID=UPI002FE479C5